MNMPRFPTRPLAVALAGGLSCLLLCGHFTARAADADEDHDWGVAATSQLRRPPYSAPTPREIPGGKVITTAQLRDRTQAQTGGAVMLIDVASGDGHVTLADSLWLAGIGRGTSFLDPAQAYVAEMLGKLTGGDKRRPLVFFCVNVQCWLSYNAALRAIMLGYSEVYWYRGGVEAWRAAGLPLARAQPLVFRIE